MTRDLVRERRTAYRTLAARVPVFSRLIDTYGRPSPFQWHDGGRTGSSHFAAMVLHIIGQQISARVAFAVYDRVMAADAGIPTPENIRSLGLARLRECGLSAAKANWWVDGRDISRTQSATPGCPPRG